jgi:murein L,D-transpeptidase YcbB/YkuD
MRFLERSSSARRWLALVAIATVVLGCEAEDERLERLAPLLRQRLTAAAAEVRADDDAADRLNERVEKSVLRFYRDRGFRPAWSDGRQLRPEAEELVEILARAGRNGLDAEDYAPADLAAQSARLAGRGLAAEERETRLLAVDLALSRAFVLYGYHALAGRLEPQEVGVEWYANPRRADLAAILRDVLDARRPGRVGEALAALAPPHPGFAALAERLQAYRAAAAEGPWPALPDETELRPGASGPAVETLRAMLRRTGDLGEAAPTAPASFDASLTEALRRFQERHGLDPSGELDAATAAALAVPPARRARIIELNLERWRWLPADLGPRHLVVNIPAFVLEVVEDGAPVFVSRVVVGKPYQRTPVMSDEMTYIVLNPYWNVPPGIAKNEILPAIERDPGYVFSQNLEIEYDDAGNAQVRQRPGPGNALGKVKFVFPNRQNIYLHDTPADHLFARDVRGFSHGCIRVERPQELAAFLLRDDPDWTPEGLAAAIAGGETRTVPLAAPIPVHILYWTAWVDARGRLQFRGDVYEHDARLDAALRQRDRRRQPARVALLGDGR